MDADECCIEKCRDESLGAMDDNADVDDAWPCNSEVFIRDGVSKVFGNVGQKGRGTHHLPLSACHGSSRQLLHWGHSMPKS